MASAAMQAQALGDCLDRAVGGDFVYDGTTGKTPPGTDLVNRHMGRRRRAHDDAVALRFNEVAALVRRPETMLTRASSFGCVAALAVVERTVDRSATAPPSIPTAACDRRDHERHRYG